MSDLPPALEIQGLCKSYGPVRVLEGVDLTLRSGEVHALVGENGAGKSTLSRILCGLTRADSGSLTWQGAPYHPADRREAERAGVRMVLQELNVIGTLSVAESLALDRLPHRLGWINRPALHLEARRALERVGCGWLDPARLMGSLGVGQQQMVEIASALARQCRLLILDEPTAALTAPETEALFLQIRALRAAGAAILYISHRLEEIRQIADRVSVLRDGQLVATKRLEDIPLKEIIRLMVGREMPVGRAVAARTAGETVLEVRDVSGPPAVRGVSFSVRRGEVLGFAGLMGSGRTETMRMVFGADRRQSGEVLLHGRPLPKSHSPSESVRRGMALLTENRKEQGLVLPLSVAQNITLAALNQFARLGGWLKPAEERGAAAEWVTRLGVRCRDPRQAVRDLSGGNQQKVVLAKWLLRDCDLLIFDEPTRGIDVGAKFEIYQLLESLAGQGKAIIIISSDLPELMATCDRIAVMSAGTIASVFERGEWTEDRIMAAAFSGYLKRETV